MIVIPIVACLRKGVTSVLGKFLKRDKESIALTMCVCWAGEVKAVYGMGEISIFTCNNYINHNRVA